MMAETPGILPRAGRPHNRRGSALDRQGKDSYRTTSLGAGGSSAGESILCEEAEDGAHARVDVGCGVPGTGFLRLLLVSLP